MGVIVGLILRHAAGGLGAALAAKGVISASEVETAAGALVWLGSTVWSYYQKKKSGVL